MYPMHRATLQSFIDPVGPLARVIIDDHSKQETKLREIDLPTDEQVLFKFVKQKFKQCYKLTPEEKFVAYLTLLERNFNT